MRILLIAATTFEIDHFIKNNKNVEILICGVGTPETMYHLTKKILQDTYDLVIQAGIGGAFSKKLKKGEVVLVKQDAFADVGAEANGVFKTIFQLGFGDGNKFPFSKGWLVNQNEILQTTHLQVVSAVTVNKLSDRKKQTLQFQKVFDADIESMEGAALHYACLQNNIPFLQMRSISNRVGERDRKKWKMKEALKNLNIELIKLVKTLY
ncbi:MAG: futalosine hydrolase [Ginsengibacter sp.]